MKNILVIDTLNNCNCDLLSNVNDGTNSVVLDIRSDASKNPRLELSDMTVLISNDRLLYEIPSNYYFGDDFMVFRFTDDEHVGESFQIKQITNIDGNLFLAKKSNFSYELLINSNSSDTDVPIATNTTLGVVKGGNNVHITPDGTMYVEGGATVNSITDAELDEICNASGIGEIASIGVGPIDEQSIDEICN